MEKQVCILMGSPRRTGNTAALLRPLTAELEKLGCRCETVWLYDLDLRPCLACRTCQRDWNIFGCAIRDDMEGSSAGCWPVKCWCLPHPSTPGTAPRP